MTKPVKLHVGYVGITREGKRVEIIENSYKNSTNYTWQSKGHCYTDQGLFLRDTTTRFDIIGPWVETPVEPLVDYKSHSDANYNDGKWHRWAGVGECPVHLDSVAQVKYIGLSSVNDLEADASSFTWDSVACPIVAFRVTKEYVEPPKVPREFWVRESPQGSYRDVKYSKPKDTTGHIHVREVLTDD
jgi:hypothetical protein